MSECIITDFGAIGDGQQLATEAIQTAIDRSRPGDTVVIPRGIYLSGALFLKGELTLRLEERAVLLGSSDPADYPVLPMQYEGFVQPCYASLLNLLRGSGTEAARDVRICGKGKIHGNGALLGPRELAAAAGARGRTVYMEHVRHLVIEDTEIREAPAWCLHLFHCDDVTIRRIHLQNKFREDGTPIGLANNDGIDPDCCSHVLIENCDIASEDDCVAVKSGRDQAGRDYGVPSRDIVIRGCRFRNGFGVAVGSEMSGSVENVLVSDCTFENSFSVGSVKTVRGRGAVIRNIRYERCELVNHDTEFLESKWFHGAINVDMCYGLEEGDTGEEESRPVTEGTPSIHDVVFRDITLSTVGGYAIYLRGLPESPLRQIVLDNITAKARKGIYVQNALDVSIHRLQTDACPSFCSCN